MKHSSTDQLLKLNYKLESLSGKVYHEKIAANSW